MANTFLFITSCETIEGKRFKRLDKRRALNRFVIGTKAGKINVAVLGSAQDIKRLTLSARWESIDVIYSRRGKGQSMLVKSKAVWKNLSAKDLTLLQEWLSPESSLEGIINADDFMRELRLLVTMLRENKRLPFKRSLVKRSNRRTLF